MLAQESPCRHHGYMLTKALIAKALAIIALVLAIFAFFGVGIGSLSSVRELALAIGCVTIAMLRR